MVNWDENLDIFINFRKINISIVFRCDFQCLNPARVQVRGENELTIEIPQWSREIQQKRQQKSKFYHFFARLWRRTFEQYERERQTETIFDYFSEKQLRVNREVKAELIVMSIWIVYVNFNDLFH